MTHYISLKKILLQKRMQYRQKTERKKNTSETWERPTCDVCRLLDTCPLWEPRKGNPWIVGPGKPYISHTAANSPAFTKGDRGERKRWVGPFQTWYIVGANLFPEPSRRFLNPFCFYYFLGFLLLFRVSFYVFFSSSILVIITFFVFSFF